MDLTNTARQFCWWHVLQQVPACACLQRTLDLDVTFESRQHHDPCFGKLTPNCDQNVDATHVRQSQVQQSHVRHVLPELLSSLGTRRRFTDKRHVRLIVHECGDALTQQRMIVNTEDSNRWFITHDLSSLS